MLSVLLAGARASFSKWTPIARSHQRARRATATRRWLSVEALEDRCLLSRYLVNHTPYLQLGNAPLAGFAGSATDRVQIIWQTVPASGTGNDSFVVEYRRAGAATWVDAGSSSTINTGVSSRVNRFVDVTGLDYDADYEYRVRHMRDGSVVKDYQAPFHTRLPKGSTKPFTFVAYGDSANGNPPKGFINVQNRINTITSSFSVLMGDNAYDSGTHAELDLRFDPTINAATPEYNKNHVEYYGLGNHDVYTAGGQPSRDNYAVPIPVAGVTSSVNGPAGAPAENNYSFDFGNAHILTYDSNDGISTAEANWMLADMQASTAKWKVIFFHHPMSTTDSFADKLRAAGVDVLLGGHQHSYSRSNSGSQFSEGNQLIQVICGTGGESTTTSKQGFLKIGVTATSLTVSYVRADSGSTTDSFTLTSPNSGSAPTNIALSANSVAENSANNTVIGALTTTDPDAGDSHTYSLTDNAGGRFGISGNQLVVANGSLLDFETNTSHTVTVLSTDSTGLSFSKNFTINVTNVNEAPTTTVTLQDGVNGYAGTIDTTIKGDQPTSTSGSSATTVEADGDPDRGSLVHWELPSSLTGSIVQSASLTLSVTSSTTGTYEPYELWRSWTEGDATWNQSAAGTPWGAAGAQQIDVDRAAAVLASVTSPTTGFVTINLNLDGIALVQKWINTPSTNHGVTIQNYVNTTSDNVRFESSEATTATNRPKLTITYTTGASEVTVQGNEIGIVDGDTTPGAADGTDFGSALQSGTPVSKSFTVRNDGTATLTLSGLVVPAGFTVIEPLTTILAPGVSDTFTVRLDTATTGTKSGQISFTTNDSDENPFNFSLTGTVIVPTPEVTVEGNLTGIADGDTTPSAADGTDFGGALQGGTPISKSFTVRNDGTANLTLSGLVVPAGFTLTEPLAVSLAPGASDTFTVRLDTATAGTKSGQISFTTNDSGENPFNFSITGTVTVPAPEVTVEGNGTGIADGDTTPGAADGTDFGSVLQGGTPVSRSFTVRNVGTANLTLSGLVVPAGFALTEPLAFSLAPGVSDTFTVRLDTATAGTKSGQVSFTTNDSDENPFNFSLTGTVTVPAPEVTVEGNGTGIADGDTTPGAADGTDFGSVLQGGTPVSKSFTVRNDGTANLTLSGLLVPAGFTLTEPLAASLTPGTSDTFTVRLDTATAGTKSGQVSFTTNDSDENPFNFSLTGTVTVSTSVTVSFQDGVDGYAGTIDTTIKGDYPTSTTGASAATVEAKDDPDRGSLVRWELPSIPMGSIVQSASITVWVTNRTTGTYDIYELLRSWTEESATWNQYATGAAWATAGAQQIGVDRGAAVLASFAPLTTGFVTINLNSDGVAMVQNWIKTPSANHGVTIQNYVTTTADAVQFDSSEATTVTNRPKLTITYGSGGSLIAASTASVTGSARTGSTLTDAALARIGQEAIARWLTSTPAGMHDAIRTVAGSIKFNIADLPGQTLGTSFEHTILIDRDAAGFGWFIDRTPRDDREFDASHDALPTSPAFAHMDLLSVVAHEIGHTLGYDHNNTLDVMRDSLAAGHRTILIDPDATGFGGLIGRTPRDDREFSASHDALLTSPAFVHVDLPSVVAREEIIGYLFDNDDDSTLVVVSDSLEAGRRTITGAGISTDAVDAFFQGVGAHLGGPVLDPFM